MESTSDEERWVICPVCHKGNPAGTRFCQHCWGAILTGESPVSAEELARVTRRSESSARRKRTFKTASTYVAVLAVICFVVLFLCYFSDIIVKPDTTINSASSDGNWSMFRRDLSHTASIGSADTVPSGVLKWVFPTGAAIRSSATVVDGKVYFGSQDFNLYVLDAETGDEDWSFKTGSWVDSSPSVVDGIVYFGSNDSNIYALDADNGDEIWKFDTDYPVKSAPAVTDDMVYVRADDYYLYALDIQSGKEVWRFNNRSPSGSSTVVSDGIVFVGSGDGNCYALNATNGQRRLRFKAHYSVMSTPAVVDGTVYFATESGYLYAIDGSARTWLQEHEIRPFWIRMWAFGLPGVPKPPDPSGLLWGVTLSRGNTASSPLVTDDSIYIGSGNYLIAVDLETHQVRWKFTTGGTVRSSPVIAGSAVIVGSEDGNLYAVDSATGEMLWSFATGDKITSSPTVADGVIYVGSQDGKLYAIE